MMSSETWNFAINSVCYVGFIMEIEDSLQKILEVPEGSANWKSLSSSLRRSSKLMKYFEKILAETYAEA